MPVRTTLLERIGGSGTSRDYTEHVLKALAERGRGTWREVYGDIVRDDPDASPNAITNALSRLVRRRLVVVDAGGDEPVYEGRIVSGDNWRDARRSAPTARDIGEGSIQANVLKILNSRQGIARACMAYGLPNLDVVLQDRTVAARRLREQIRDTIREYEPRLDRESVRVRVRDDVDDPLVLSLEIKGNVMDGRVRRKVRIPVSLDPFGAVRASEGGRHGH